MAPSSFGNYAKWVSSDRISVALQNAVVCLVSYVVGAYFTGLFHGRSSSIGVLWSVVTGMVVLQATTHDAWQSALLRVLGTLIGATIGDLYLQFFPFSVIGMAASVGLTVLLSQALNVPDHGRLAAITVALIIVISTGAPELSPFINAALRFAEAVIGAGIGVLAVLLWPKTKEAG